MDGINIKGREYRVECNWRACIDFLQKKGSDSMSALADIARLAPSDCALLAWCCIREGERLEGRECDLSQDFIDLMSMPDAMGVIAAFINIYSEQSQPKIKADSDKKKD